MSTRLAHCTAALLVLLAPAAFGGAVEDKLGEAYTKAAPAEKLAMLSVAQYDRVLEASVVRPAMEEAVRGALAGGETPEARLRLFGQLRADATTRLAAISEERKKTNARAVNLVEPDSETQLALALDYVAAACGDRPTVEELACLKLVRDATAWSYHTKLVVALLVDALARDATYQGAALEARLTTIRTLAQDRQMMSDHERTVLESALLVEHASASLAAGESVGDVRARVKRWSDQKLICFFTRSFVDGMLERLEQHRAARRP